MLANDAGLMGRSANKAHRERGRDHRHRPRRRMRSGLRHRLLPASHPPHRPMTSDDCQRRAPAPPAACGHSASLSSWSASWSSTPSSTNCADRLADGGAEQVAADRPLASYRADLSPGHEPRRFCHGHIVSLQYAAEAVPAGGRRHRIVPLVTRLVTGVRSDIFPGSPWNNRSQRSGRLLA